MGNLAPLRRVISLNNSGTNLTKPIRLNNSVISSLLLEERLYLYDENKHLLDLGELFKRNFVVWS